MIRIAACDDNELLLSLLKEFLQTYIEESNETIEACFFTSAEELLKDVKENRGGTTYTFWTL